MKITKRLLIIFALVLAFLLGGCCMTVVDAEQNHPIKIWGQNENGCYNTLKIVDEDTGVNYIVVSWDMYSEPGGIAITPRLNADGSLYVSK